MLLIRTSRHFFKEKEYIFHTIFSYFWGLIYEVEFIESYQLGYEIFWKEQCIVKLVDCFFEPLIDNWLQRDSLPISPLSRVKLVDNTLKNLIGGHDELPIIYGAIDNKCQQSSLASDFCGILQINIDIFGSIFFMLSRYEEHVVGSRDMHNRFSSGFSLASIEGLINRPVVNEYLEIFWYFLIQRAPLTRKKRLYQLVLTHDVDRLLTTINKPASCILRNTYGDVFSRKSLALAARRVSAFLRRGERRVSEDPSMRGFDMIMSLSENMGVESHFYFIANDDRFGIDGDYSIHDSVVRQLMCQINLRGHHIGLHPSYHSYKCLDTLVAECSRLRCIMDNLDIQSGLLGGRQHYLRWEPSITWQNWEEAGLDYDSSLMFPDEVGFRCGICYEFPVYSLKQRRRLKLLESPLIVMDATLFNGRSDEQAFDVFQNLKSKVQFFNGNFVVLFHNNEILSRAHFLRYKNLLTG